MNTISEAFEMIGIPARHRSTPEQIGLLRHGIAVTAVEHLGEAMNVPKSRMADYLGVSLRHLQRNREGRLDRHQSEHLVAMASLFAQGIRYFGSREQFMDWLDSEHPALGGKPASYLDTITGIQFVQERLSRMAHGDLA